MRKLLLTLLLVVLFPLTSQAARQTLNNGVELLNFRTVINDNFTELYGKVVTSAALSGTNLVITLDDATTITAPLAGLQDGTGTDNQQISALSFDDATDILTITIEGGNTATVNLSDLAGGGSTELDALTDVAGEGTTDYMLYDDGDGTFSFRPAPSGTGGEANVQPDWDESDAGSDAYIRNKPTIPPDSSAQVATNETSITGNASAINANSTNITSNTSSISGHVNNLNNPHGIVPAQIGAQSALVSGTNIKTINGESVLGAGDITVSGFVTVDSTIQDGSTNPVQNDAIYDALALKVNTADITDITPVAPIQYSSGNLSVDVGTGANQVAAGDHNHTGVYEAADTDLTALAGLACSDGQIPKLSGGVWTCGTDNNSGGSFSWSSVPVYEDSAGSAGDMAYDDSYLYVRTSTIWKTVALVDTLDPAPATYTFTWDIVDGNGTDYITYNSANYTVDGSDSGLTADVTFTVAADTGRQGVVTGSCVTGTGPYTVNTDSEDCTATITFSDTSAPVTVGNTTLYNVGPGMGNINRYAIRLPLTTSSGNLASIHIGMDGWGSQIVSASLFSHDAANDRAGTELETVALPTAPNGAFEWRFQTATGTTPIASATQYWVVLQSPNNGWSLGRSDYGVDAVRMDTQAATPVDVTDFGAPDSSSSNYGYSIYITVN